MSEYKVEYDSELDSFQLYHRYEEPQPNLDWKRAALSGPALPALGNAVAGAVGSALSNVATYPLSLIVARLQTQKVRRGTKSEKSASDAEYTSVLDAARKIYAEEGIASFYTGLAQDTIKSVADSFLFFLAYEFFRQRRIRARFGNTRRSKHTVLPVLDELAVGVLAGAFAKLFTTPLANIVARKQTAKDVGGGSTKEIAARIRAEKGLRGFWSGYSASLILTLNPSITFFLNAVLKYALLPRSQRQKRPSAVATFFLAAVSKSIASSVTYPFSMAKTRAQVAGSQITVGADGEKKKEDEGVSLMPAIVSNVAAIARTEGVAALYAGLPGEVLKGFFSHGFTMLAKDAVYSAIVKSYYLLLLALRRYPTPEELLQRAREQAEEFADAAREGARDLAERTRSGTEEVLSHQAGGVTVDMTSSELADSNETAEMVGDYVEDDGSAKTYPMSTDPHPGPGLGDLEKELTCSICTDLLYQPLTLLDCLHTFCGSCLKEWFSAQASRARSSSSVRFTCPSCRAVVRETRPNATVTTPDRDKSAEEKEEIAQRYKHGDSVGDVSDDEDRRLLEEVRELSLQESRSRQSSRTRRTESSAEVDGARQRRREEERAARRRQGETAAERNRRIEHHLSDTETIQDQILRQILEEGLLDDIDFDNLGPAQEEELSERIADAYRRRHRLRSRSQQRLEARETNQTSSRARARSHSTQRPREIPTQNETSRNPPVSRPHLLDPLVARNGNPGHQRRLSDQGSSRRRTSPVPANPASSSEVTLRPAARSSSDVVTDRPRNSQAARVRTESSPRSRRATASEQSTPNIWVEGARERAIRRAPGRLSIDSPRVVAAPEQNTHTGSWPASPGMVVPASSSLVAEVGGTGRSEARSRPSSSRSNAPRSAIMFSEPSISCNRCGKEKIQYDLHKKCPKCNDGGYHLCLRCYRTGEGCLEWAGFAKSAEADFERIIACSSGHPSPLRSSSQQHILQSCKYRRAPDIAYRPDRDGRVMTTDDPAQRLTTGFFCDSCQSPANDCYWKCDQCNEGDWGFCNRCVNQGRCCTHALLPICRIPPDSNSTPTATATATTTDNTPSPSLETYKILSIATNCDICTHPIPDSTPRFHCLQCNNGDYDICTNCYLRLVAIGKIRKENGHNGWRRCLKGHRMAVIGFEDHEEGQRRVILRDLVGGRALNDDHLIQPSSPTASPITTISTSNSTIASPEVGSGDWSWKEGSERRKKASRIRPWTIGDRDRDRDRSSEPNTPTTITTSSPFTISSSAISSQISSSTNSTTTTNGTRRYPPDGGVGLVVHALWSWYPEDGVKDELMFPRGAEITEAENINDDWYWGCYAGLTGLFPGAHVFVAGEVV
ncbi:hypothetical protein BO83DRAFT_406999 [Aspergillus eucalypticola CBS 122712]|uniref:RING-type domain-containing protein n=1 Tax=Aspergillus eucalypticola (strain CBS 122712 / IBT 29274) TaxID=1448314 RepID=A0A317VT77_ASPEC|nr:uncharacterized protein BO83DRAFT_406999 [Aspergillus eucalypticola CBS 122712]PWY76521.1 hypothetical protein BO83DRAFT_406999 [Aspergillus eucalypticola CBS 122712]